MLVLAYTSKITKTIYFVDVRAVISPLVAVWEEKVFWPEGEVTPVKTIEQG